jgi:hypothetical protein
MRTSAKLGVTAFMAAFVLASVVSASSARTLSLSNQSIRVTWSSLELVGGVTVRCQLTLEGSFHSRTMFKVKNTIGVLTRAIIKEESCVNGRARPRTETLPWQVKSELLVGSPNITSAYALLSRVRFLFILPGLCTGEYGTSSNNITGLASISETRAITTLSTVSGRNTITKVSGSAFCPASGTFAGTGQVYLLNSTTRVSLTEI